jgi:hypothetical protein
MAVPRWSAKATWFGGLAAVGVALLATQLACGGADSQSSEQATAPSGAPNVMTVGAEPVGAQAVDTMLGRVHGAR